MWTVDGAALERIAIGAGILGTGGGGNPYLGKLHAQLLVARTGPVTVVAPEEVPDDALVVSVGGMGAPIVSNERIKQGEEELNALRTLERHVGRRCTHLIAGEIGGANAMRPLAVASQTGLPVVDGDGMGRAFPELQMDTFAIYGVPSTPAALADPHGQIAIFETLSALMLERYARAVTIQMGGAAGYAFPPMSGADLKRTVVPNTVTLAHAIGDAVLTARRRHTDPIAAVLGVAGGQRLFAGKVVDVERRLVGGFARGVLRLDGTGDDTGRTLRIDLQNEYLIARTNDDQVLAVVPDLICLVDADSAEPVTTEVVRYGLRVTVLGVPAPAQLKTPEALAVIGPAPFGYRDVPYLPLPGTYGQGQESVAHGSGTGHPQARRW